jgi:hypothetical protein
VKHALAQFSVTPTLDFELDASIQQLSSIQQPFTKKKNQPQLLVLSLRDLQKKIKRILSSQRIEVS